MFLKRIKQTKQQILNISTFNGLAHPIKAKNNQFVQSLNMSPHNYPALSTRPPLYKIASHATATQLFAHDALIEIRDNSLYYKNAALATLSPGKKQIVSMGGNIIIFPDKLIYSPQNHSVTQLEAQFISQGSVSLSLAQEDGTIYQINYVDHIQPTTALPGETWLNLNTNTLHQYDGQAQEFVELTSVFVALSVQGIGVQFKVGDAVQVSGIEEQQGESLNGSRILCHVSENTIVFNGILNSPRYHTTITVSRTLPDMDNICVWNNRLWGSKGHEVFASKLGDPCNFYVFNGISTDSFAMTLDNKQPFTALHVFDDELLLFCEDEIFKISGNRPANYRVSRNIALGVERNSPQSLCQIGNSLYYVSSQGVCSYRHSAELVDTYLNSPDWRGAIAFALGGNLMLCTKNDGIYVYSTEYRNWYRWSDITVLSAIAINGRAYIVDDENNIYCTDNSNGGIEETNLPWFAETADIALRLPDNRFIDRLELNIKGQGSYGVDISFDTIDNPEWKTIREGNFSENINTRIAINTKNFHHVRLKIRGIGSATILSLILYIRNRGDL
ncbi:MAG: hypothetical protein GYA87_03030 [Christensenellaceae bacterium]|nr:hypothetical protein [Christensenellaceae bacterium]